MALSSVMLTRRKVRRSVDRGHVTRSSGEDSVPLWVIQPSCQLLDAAEVTGSNVGVDALVNEAYAVVPVDTIRPVAEGSGAGCGEGFVEEVADGRGTLAPGPLREGDVEARQGRVDKGLGTETLAFLRAVEAIDDDRFEHGRPGNVLFQVARPE